MSVQVEEDSGEDEIMKWKGRRESANVYDGRGESVQLTVDELLATLDGPTGTAGPTTRKQKVDKYIKEHPEKMAENEIRKLDKKGKIPTPTPNPRKKEKTKVQVTPGTWNTNKI